jgi:hypothetical protein
MKRFALLVLAACLALPAAAADSGLAIAGRGATLEQVLSAPHPAGYRLLIRSRELERIAAPGARDEVVELLERARRGGAVLFACEKDLRAQELRLADLPRGVVTLAASHVWENGASTPADRQLREICS